MNLHLRVLPALMAAAALAAHAAPPTFQSLMDPAVFPDPQCGMTVESAACAPEGLSVITTGAEFRLDTSGNGVFRQRIGHARELARIHIDGVTQAPALTHSGPGLAFARFEQPRFDLRVNGDSLFMFHAHVPLTIEISRAIDVGFKAQYKSNCVLFDEYGGFGVFSSDPALESAINPYDPMIVRHTLSADAVLWIGICPPKPYDWNRSISDHVVWHWSNTLGYPADADLAAWAQAGNVVLLQSEVMLWKDWNLAFEPRLGLDEFARVRETIHRHGMRFIVYTSPYYFLKNTPIESKAMNSFENFAQTGFPPGWPDGVNIDLFMDEIAKVMREYRPDGLYFDGQYSENPAALYALARRTRALLGEEGILEWHSTAALGYGLCFLPQADAYVDFILRGEGRDSAYADFDYLRYFVSCYNTSNSIGVLCNNCAPPTAPLVDQVLAANARMHTIVSWMNNPGLMALAAQYRAQLTPALRAQTEQAADARQRNVAPQSRMREEEERALRAQPDWDTPLLAADAVAMLQWTSAASPQNPTPFALSGDALSITAKAHTYAYLTQPLQGNVRGFTCAMKQDSDGGMSWGPAVCLRGTEGVVFRVGLRSDGLLQYDLLGEQRLFGKQEPSAWIHIRVRWLTTAGVIETSRDGVNWTPVCRFEHGGSLTHPMESISIGKVPYHGGPADHPDPGPGGVCFAGKLAVY